MAPGEFAFDAGGDAIGRAVGGFDLEDVAVFGPDLVGAADGAVGADGFGDFGALRAHLSFHLGEREDGPVADWRFDAFDDVDHLVECGWRGYR